MSETTDTARGPVVLGAPPSTILTEAIRNIVDPKELRINVVNLGLVYEHQRSKAQTVNARSVIEALTLTSAACPLTGNLIEDQTQVAAGVTPPMSWSVARTSTDKQPRTAARAPFKRLKSVTRPLTHSPYSSE